jgi:diguanylate cyclase (GGDEF)-like protein
MTTEYKQTLLLIDDNIINLKIALEQLQAYNFEILTARNGEAGIVRAQETQPALILLDVQMPGMDGFEICRRLKAHPRTADIPVIFMTALAELADKARGFDAGAVDYLTKPLEAAELLMRVRLHLRLRALQQAQTQSNAQLTTLVKQLEQRNYELQQLNTLIELLQTCQTSAEACDAIARSTLRLLPDTMGALYLLAPSRNLLEAVATWGALPADGMLFSPEACWALRRSQTHLVKDLQMDLLCQHVTHPTPHVCVPLQVGSDTLGLLHVRHPSDPAFIVAKQALITMLAEHIALSLSNLKLRELLRQQSIRDALTGLFNRRYLEETLTREVYRAQRGQTPLSAIMLDVDHFKRFNDTFGHEAGDLILQTLGQFLQKQVRASDVPCRYGGEEFAVILPSATAEQAAQRAETLRAGAETLQATFKGQTLGKITLSLGVASLPQHGDTGEDVLQAADAALYQAKQAGRNRVVVAIDKRVNAETGKRATV